MKKLKLSPWHDGSVKPVHVGVYEVKWGWDLNLYKGGIWFNFWDGKKFHVGNGTPELSVKTKQVLPEKITCIRWRGVLK
jgi:hypothetical protein